MTPRETPDIRPDGRIGGVQRFFYGKAADLMRVPDAITKCVVFVMYAKSTSDAPDTFAGTGFWLGKRSERINTVQFGYLVTAWHVIAACRDKSVDGKVWLRVNMKDGNRGVVPTNPDDWVRHQTDPSADIAVLHGAPRRDFDVQRFPVAGSVTPDVVLKQNIGIGDSIFFPGLFAEHAIATARDVPIVRQGTIAAMPEQKVSTRQFGKIDAYLVESRSIGGLSGSPVFVHLAGIRGTSLDSLEFHFDDSFYLLGVMHGHWDHPELLPDHDGPDAGAEIDAAREKRERVNMGIAIVVPIQKVLETLDYSELVARREQQENEIMDQKLPVEDSLEDDTRPGPEPERLKLDGTMDEIARRVMDAGKPDGWEGENDE